MLGKNQKLVDCNWYAGLRVCLVWADADSVVRYQSRSIILTLPRYRTWGFERGGHRFLPRCVSVDSNLILPSQDNILVDGSGCARLNDSGLTSIVSLTCPETPVPGVEGSRRWMAPEILNIEQNAGRPGVHTPQSDIFALGMVTFEVMTSSLFALNSPNLAYPGVHGTSAVPGERPANGNGEDQGG